MDCQDRLRASNPSTQRNLPGRFRFAVSSLVLALSAGCDKIPALPKRGTNADSTAKPAAKAADTARAPFQLGLGATYAAATLSSVGSVAGTLSVTDSGAVGDSAAAAAPECAPRGRRPAPLPASKRFGNAIVWIADAKTGKPMPIEKRAELSSDNCILDPRVQAVTVGTTVNVINDDKVLHKLIFTKFGTHDTLVVVPFFNSGQIVATERLAKTPGIVEVKCVDHPWEHGYIAVFDHPYFAVTEDTGAFKIDSLAPGSYKVMMWHEGMTKPAEQQVQVTPGGTATVFR
jgi:hypothetical protein